ncbi:MBT domain-containing protein 1-like isoform X2 [Watersipora subatra]|uniref:MBT domain-containing protein 1-like isoform X2 n=1 Tax=Watersipora subatra TaxID=2589382 RepID=UPI00355C99A7
MTNEKTCEVCSASAPLTSCIKVDGLSYCSKDCSIRREEMPQRKRQRTALKRPQPFDWGTYLDSNKADAAPVHSFKHCTSDEWLEVFIGTKVEVALPKLEKDIDEDCYWIASIVKTAGYKAKLRWEGCGSDSSLDFWMSITSPDIHEISWAAAHRKKLVPALSQWAKKTDWREYLLRKLVGCRTLPDNFRTRFLDKIGKHRFCKGMRLEIMDKMCVAAMKVAKVVEVVDCRLHLQYEGAGVGNDSNDFWCHTSSSLIHPVGWAAHVGHRLHASAEYIQSSQDKFRSATPHPDDTTLDMFNNDPLNVYPPGAGSGFAVGMKLEAIDPLNLSAICVATVMKVLKDNYLMIGIDGCMDKRGNDWFCYHATSASLLPAGYCDINNIPLTPPKGYEGKFSWRKYVVTTQSRLAPVTLFTTKVPPHSFRKGIKLEAVDLMDPKLICVGTVQDVVGRLLRIRFDGWEDSFDQWVDVESPDIYPVGWCELINYSLERPRTGDVKGAKTK